MLLKLKQYKQRRYINQLISKGLNLGENVYLNDGFFLDPAHCHLITIEDDVVFGPGVRCFAHDASTLKVIGKTLIAEIRICRNAFIGAQTVILPGVTIGENSIVGAGSVVTKDIPPNEIWAGIPVKFITDIPKYREKLLTIKGDDFSYSNYAQENLTLDGRSQQIESLRKNGIGYMKP